MEIAGLDVECQLLRDWLRANPGDIPDQFSDPFHSRFRTVVKAWLQEQATSVEVAVILRQVVKRADALLGPGTRISKKWGMPDLALSEVGIDALPVGDMDVLRIREWAPPYLEKSPGDLSIDFASLAGLAEARRALYLHNNHEQIEADKAFRDSTLHSNYRSTGQLAVTRSLLCLEPGSTLIGVLPTGSGKTDVAATGIVRAFRDGKTSVVVVPTTALALDLEVRFQRLFSDLGENMSGISLAMHAETGELERNKIRERVRSGQQPVIITSPESLSRSAVRDAVISAAQTGLLGWFVIDEAHMVIEWGSDFRMEFAELSDFAKQLVEEAREYEMPPCRCLLLSATLSPSQIRDLSVDFSKFGRVHLVSSNQFRPELDIWIADMCSREERRDRLLDAVRHLPRPLVIYATRPHLADEYLQLLRANGFTRSAVFTGKTAGEDRRDVLRGFSGAAGAFEYDIVLATSAFGLGVDLSGVRTVIHACIPETVSRWYQEIGRGGRDGYASCALMLPAVGDLDEAMSLGVRRLKASTAAVRWNNLYASKEVVREDWAAVYLDLSTSSDAVGRGSYNRRWNAQLLIGLEELGLLERDHISRAEMDRLGLPIRIEDDVESEWIRVTNVKVDAISQIWSPNGIWETWKDERANRENNGWQRLRDLAERRRSACDVLFDDVRVPPMQERFFDYETYRGLLFARPCGRCPGCRKSNSKPSTKLPTACSHWQPTNDVDERLIGFDEPLVIAVPDQQLSEAIHLFVYKYGIRHVVWPGRVDEAPEIEGFVDEGPDRLEASPRLPLLCVGLTEGLINVLRLRSTAFPGLPTVVLVGDQVNHEDLPFSDFYWWSDWKREHGEI